MFNVQLINIEKMIKIKCFYLLCVTLLSISSIYSQPMFTVQLGGGLALPMDDTKGNFSARNGIDTSFMKSNYGGGTGFNVTGAFKYSIDKSAYTRAVIFGSLNSFSNRSSGFTNEGGYLFPVKHNWTLNFTNVGFGLEFMPFPKGPFSPFINTNFIFNIMSANLTTESASLPDNSKWRETVRLGANGNAGFEIRPGKNFGIVIGATYSFQNLLLKDNDNVNHFNFGKQEIGFNDAGGFYFSNMYDGGYSQQYEGNEKKFTSLSIYAGLSFYIYPEKKKEKKPAGF
jgi:hypothetical protein